MLTKTSCKGSSLCSHLVSRPCFQNFSRKCRAIVVQAAKKEKKGAQKKGGSAIAELLKKKQLATEVAEQENVLAPGELAIPAQYSTPELRTFLFFVCQSYWRYTKKYLLDGVGLDTLCEALYRAPFVLLAHDKFQPGVEDPVFTYGNRAALELFEMDWSTLVGTPSRKSVAPAAEGEVEAQKTRDALLDKAAQKGVVENYEGWRISSSGRRFKVLELTLFNILGAQGEKIGQAAVFSKYMTEAGLIVEITGDSALPPPLELPPTGEDIAAADQAVAEQAEIVRSLKESRGLGNQDPEVVAAVTELKSRKAAALEVRRKVEEAIAAAKDAFDDDDDDE